MKAKTLLYAAVVAAVSVSCTREAEESGLLNSGIDLEFTAEWADEKDADSRTVLQEDGTSIWWSANEEINVFIGKDVSAKFVSTNTQPQGVVSFVGNVLIGAAEQNDTFPGYWAAYPYKAENSCDGQSLTLSLPYIQKGEANGFADKFFPSVARSNNFLLSFWNVCGGARFSVTREGIKRIVFKSNDGSPMAGKVKVGFGEDNKPQILEFTEPVDSVVVNAPEGGFIPSTHYFAAMLPQTHEQGLSVTLWMADKKADKAISQSISIHRSAFGLLNEIDKGLEFVDAVFPDDPSPEVDFEMVDLGLSVKWATCNLGASSPEEYGNYYAWGETERYGNRPWDARWKLYKWCMGSESTLTKYCTDPNYGYNSFTDNKIILDPEDDAAKVTLGGDWRMPTIADWEELMNNSVWTWCWLKSTYGYKVTSLVPGFTDKWIFLPSRNYVDDWYWSSIICPKDPSSASVLIITHESAGFSYYSRASSLFLRPVNGDYIHPTKISLNKKILEMSYGAVAQLSVSISPLNVSNNMVAWRSSDETVCTVSSTGVITASGCGDAVITVSAIDGGLFDNCQVSVVDEVAIPELIDLGLSVKWASFNLGALSPEDYGYYYSWGETEWKDDCSWSTYKWWMDGSIRQLTKYCNNPSYGYNGFTDDKMALDTEDDAAAIALGGNWRIPTYQEWEELNINCTWTWTTLNGIFGIKVTSNLTGYTDNWIFLPAAGCRDGTSLSDAGSYGYYWSSSLGTDNPFRAYNVYFYLGSVYLGSYYCRYRSCGQSVRPVFFE